MGGSTHLSTWVDEVTKERFANAAAIQGLGESALLRRLVQQMLAAGSPDSSVPDSLPDSRDTRVTVRLMAEDRALLRERAAARSVPAATYVSYLLRAHLRGVAPLPEPELDALRATVAELSAHHRTLQTLAQLLQSGGRPNPPGWTDVQRLLRIGDALLDRFRALIKANLVSWTTGRAP